MVVQTLRERLTLALVALLPLHALMVTVLTKAFYGAGFAPSSMISVWKEVLLAIILGLAIFEYRNAFRQVKITSRSPLFDMIDVLVVALVLVAVLVSSITHGDPKLFLFGWKYDFLPPVAFLILRRVHWSDTFIVNLQRTLIVITSFIIGFALISLFLPQDFFTRLGYSDLHSIYVSGKPLAAFQYISETGMRRVQSTMSGPNQLGIWLLIPLSFAVISTLHSKFPKEKTFERLLGWLYADHSGKKWFRRFYVALLAVTLVLTFSRSAWLAAMGLVLIAFLRHFGRERFWRWALRFGAACIFFLFMTMLVAPDAILRISSSRGHLVRPIQALYQMIDSPLGGGLGSAGPASHRVTDTCVHLRPQDDPSWASDRQDLCVFLGSQQVQPLDRECRCPRLPENWYLQIGLELGIAGFLIYMAFLGFMLRALWSWRDEFDSDVALSVFVGVSIAAMTLHAWEDAAIAYTAWILFAVVFSRKSEHHGFLRHHPRA